MKSSCLFAFVILSILFLNKVQNVIAATLCGLAGESESHSIEDVKEDKFLKSSYFDASTENKVSGDIGGQVSLQCKLTKNIGSTGVWFRIDKEKPYLSTKLVNSNKYRVKESSDNLEFTLTIKYLEKSDAGVYECRLASKPYIKNIYHLKVKGNACVSAAFCYLMSLFSLLRDAVKGLAMSNEM
ncbi:hypothetical protein C0J52_28202 [Blattella germanica]|nr:hypothetical protein C0J52_28203 [Blattella germanica]PSN38598.1 hypothetical protein C0J52_28202 [Blattella germanica]